MMCPGPWDPKTGEQTGPDMCMPHKNGECAAHCPQTCMDGDMMCPGKTHADGCTDADYCVPGSKFIFIYYLGKCQSLKESLTKMQFIAIALFIQNFALLIATGQRK